MTHVSRRKKLPSFLAWLMASQAGPPLLAGHRTEHSKMHLVHDIGGHGALVPIRATIQLFSAVPNGPEPMIKVSSVRRCKHTLPRTNSQRTGLPDGDEHQLLC